MKANITKLISILAFSVLLSPFVNFSPDSNIIPTLYTVAGILFSIGLGVISGFDFRDVKNRFFLKILRKNIRVVRNSFILFFSYATFALLIFQYFGQVGKTTEFFCFAWKFDFGLHALLSILFAIAYFIANFLALQKLRDQITDKVLSGE